MEEGSVQYISQPVGNGSAGNISDIGNGLALKLVTVFAVSFKTRAFSFVLYVPIGTPL